MKVKNDHRGLFAFSDLSWNQQIDPIAERAKMSIGISKKILEDFKDVWYRENIVLWSC